MKVLHVIPSLSPALGGPTQVALKIVKAIRNQGIDAEIVTTNYGDRSGVLDVPVNQRVEYQGVPVWFLAAFPLPFKEYIFSAALTKWLWQNIDNYDILDNHYLFSYAPTCAAAIARWRKIPYTVRTQGQLTPWALKQSFCKKRLYTALIERVNLSQAAAIHCTTDQEAKDLRNFGIDTPTITLPLGVERPQTISAAKFQLHQQYGIPVEREIILFLSRLHHKKRPDLLIDALSEAIARNSDCHLIMAGIGETSYVNYLQKLVEEKQLGDRISWTGFVTGKQKDLLLRGSDIFALPSHSENFGIAVAEAMAAGLPVVISPGVQIAPEIATAEAGLVVQYKQELTDALVRLIDSPELRSLLGQNAISLAHKKYDWDQIASQLITVYQNILAQ